jgi:phospholipid transport system substrate-binding protein
MDKSPSRKTASVHTRIPEDGSQPITVDYSLRQLSDEWKIYDVSIEGISLVINFRMTFAARIQNDGLDGLIQQLAERNADAAVDDTFVKESLKHL